MPAETPELFAPLGPTLRPLRVAALVRAGPALAALPRLAHRRRARRPRARRRDRHRRGRARARPAEGLLRRRRRPERRRCSRRPRRVALARRRVELVAGERRVAAVRRRRVRRAHVHLPPPLRRRPGRDAARAARVVRPGGTIAGLEFGVPHGVWRPLWELYVRVGLPAAGRPIGDGWHEVGSFLGPSIRGSTRAGRCRGCSRPGARPGSRTSQAQRLSPRRRGRDVGTQVSKAGPFYALRPGGWRDYVTLLHLAVHAPGTSRTSRSARRSRRDFHLDRMLWTMLRSRSRWASRRTRSTS